MNSREIRANRASCTRREVLDLRSLAINQLHDAGCSQRRIGSWSNTARFSSDDLLFVPLLDGEIKSSLTYPFNFLSQEEKTISKFKQLYREVDSTVICNAANSLQRVLGKSDLGCQSYVCLYHIRLFLSFESPSLTS